MERLLHEKRFNNGRDYPVCILENHGKEARPWTPHYHSECEIQFIWQGRGKYFIKDRTYAFKENSVLFVHKREVHNFIPDPEQRIHKTVLIFSPSILPTGSSLTDALDTRYHVELPENDSVFARLVLNRIRDEIAAKKIFWTESVANNVGNLLILLGRAEDYNLGQRVYPLVAKVISYVEENFRDNILLNSIARDMSISPTHLGREFAAATGLGFKRFLIQRRVVEAKKLLSETDLKVLDVAGNAGFDDLSTFNRNFKSLTGLTPSEYRLLVHDKS